MFIRVSEQGCNFQIDLLKSQICFKGEKRLVILTPASFKLESGGILFFFFKKKLTKNYYEELYWQADYLEKPTEHLLFTLSIGN